jgi:hypothetical protein
MPTRGLREYPMKTDELIDAEIEAIKAVLRALDPLPPEVRSSVLGYVRQRLKIAADQVQLAPASNNAATVPISEAAATERAVVPTHIKDFKEKKDPHSANEMAAIVGYYLANVAPQQDRKDKITTKDIETYFKIAEYPLPKKTQFTLPNARAAGYLDAIGNGEYKLNAVGHNLVAHGLPRTKRFKAASKRRPTKKARPSAQRRK